MPVRVRLEYVPRNISTPQTHLDLVDQSPSTVVLLHSLGISTTSPRVTQFTSWTTKITADRATRKCLKHRPSHHLSFLPPSHYNLTSDKTCLYTATMPPPPRPLGGGYPSLVGERGGELSAARGTIKYTHTPSQPQPPTPAPTSHMWSAQCA